MATAMRRRHPALRSRVGSLLTNGGDWIQGTPEGNADRGIGVMAALDRLQPTASVLGNHEFDFGADHLAVLLQGVRHPVLAANLYEPAPARLRCHAHAWSCVRWPACALRRSV